MYISIDSNNIITAFSNTQFDDTYLTNLNETSLEIQDEYFNINIIGLTYNINDLPLVEKINIYKNSYISLLTDEELMGNDTLDEKSI